ncbi:exosortase A [Pontixanthobacter sp. CEM42]|uniref:exosortase A n=1 Tax=Pontixanthobacter sp. CEM42 TaxID=2792077 RepID=UPI001ADF6431|nr:exosortase A [Pontixanthobacter sp. CEM42]
MPRSLSLGTAGEGKLLQSIPDHWRLPLGRLALAWLAIIALTFRDWLSMFDQWWNISTYNHILLVPFIVGWLIYDRRDQLRHLKPVAWWPGLLAVGIALFFWLIGSLAGVNTVSQLGAVLALQASTLVLLGPRIAAANLFPLTYMLFLVPFGDELVPTLQMVTADLVIALTEWSGIPAIIDGVFIDTPAGLFEVAEACSGVKFLIAMIALGTLVAYSCFKSWKRRAAFMAAAIALPILANGVRAWGTIYIAQSQGIEFAAGFDHVFYGWVFFALVVAALLAASWRYFDRDPEDLGIDLPAIETHHWFKNLIAATIGGNMAFGVVAGMLVLFGGWNAMASQVEAAVPASITLPEVNGWTRVDYAPLVDWSPKATGADHRLLGRYRSEAGQEVDVFLALYAAQEEGREASAYGEGALSTEKEWRWLAPGEAVPQAVSDYLLANGQVKRLAQTSFHHGDILTGSAAKLKLANMRDRLLLRAQPTMMLILSAEETETQKPAPSIAAFRQSIGNESEWMDRIAGLR